VCRLESMCANWNLCVQVGIYVCRLESMCAGGIDVCVQVGIYVCKLVPMCAGWYRTVPCTLQRVQPTLASHSLHSTMHTARSI